MNSAYRDIPNFKKYKISKSGKIYSKITKKLLKPTLNSNNYLRVELTSNEGVRQKKLVHRLVAKVYVENPHSKPEVNHKNKKRHDCRASNLEWMTRSENMIHCKNF